jgi:phospholipase D1/2
MSLIGSIRSKVSKIFHTDDHQRAATMNDANASGDGYASSSSTTSHPAPQMLDPSTNVNPLSGDPEHDDSRLVNDKKQKKGSADVSKHTFYIVNAQMRLKLFARNEVR